MKPGHKAGLVLGTTVGWISFIAIFLDAIYTSFDIEPRWLNIMSLLVVIGTVCLLLLARR